MKEKTKNFRGVVVVRLVRIISLTSPSCSCSPVAPRVLLDGASQVVSVVSRGGAAAGRAHGVFLGEARKRVCFLLFADALSSFLFSSLSELLLSVSRLPPPPFDSLRCVAGSQRDTRRQRKSEEKKKPARESASPPEKAHRERESDDDRGLFSFNFLLLSFKTFLNLLPPPPCCRSA